MKKVGAILLIISFTFTIFCLSCNKKPSEKSLLQTAPLVGAEIDTQKIKNEINTVKNEIEKTKNKINTQETEITLLEEKKARIDYTHFIKEPTSSLSPVAPKKKRNVMLAGILSPMIFTILAFSLEYLEKQKITSKG